MTKIDFSKRSSEHELMDDDGISFAEFHDCLQELERINILTLAYRPTLQWLKAIIKSRTLKNVSLMDIGCGGGDMLRRIATLTENNKSLSIKMFGIDLNPWSKKSAEKVPSACPIIYETSDIFQSSKDRKADVIISSLFTHHLSDDVVVKFIKWMDHHAIHGWFINDLHRQPIAYYFIKYAVLIFNRNRLIRSDAPISVIRAFSKKDWVILLEKAGIPKQNTFIRWYFPFRYCVARYK